MFDWIRDHESVAYWLVGATIVTAVATVLIVPWVILRIPPDYFTHDRRPRGALDRQNGVLRPVLRIAKNIVGGLLMLAGIAMLALPGQGLLTLFVGFLLVEGPGKYRAEKWLISRPRVLRALNWFRRKRGRKPLEAPEAGSTTGHGSETRT